MPKKKVMIVDDEVSITRLLKFALEKSGLYEVLAENNGSNAMSSIKTARPDLLILDVNMPEASGGEIAAMVREDASLKDLPIIFLTGSVSEEEAQAGLTISGFPALGKPINMEKLLGQVKKSLQ